MLMLILLSNLSSKEFKIGPITETGIGFWSAMYIPIVVAMAARHLLTQHSPRVIDGLASIEAPTLIIVGRDDEQFLAPTEMMVSRMPNAESIVIEDAAHSVNIDQPEAFDRAVLAFLEKHGL